MQRSRGIDRGDRSRARQGAGGAHQSREVARCDHPGVPSARSRSDLSLCGTLERTSTSYARRSAPTRSRPFRRRRSTRRRASSASPPRSHIHRGNGCRRSGPCARSARLSRLAAWERRSLTRGATPSLPSLESQERTISMRQILARASTPNSKPGLDIQVSTKLETDEPSFALPGASRKGKVIRPPRIVLARDQSEALRDRLVAQLSDLKSADEAANWVHKNLPVKNTLIAADADLVEAGFRERLKRSREDGRALGYQRLSATRAPNTRRTKAKPSGVLRRPLRQRRSSDAAVLRRRSPAGQGAL